MMEVFLHGRRKSSKTAEGLTVPNNPIIPYIIGDGIDQIFGQLLVESLTQP